MTDRFSKLVSALGLLIGTAAALIYYQRGLTLSHYDAKAHLVVARRVLDSLTPEYSQIGAVWLPLPHLLNLLPVQVDWFYRTGASAVAISVVSFALACYAIANLVLRVTGSRAATAVAVALFALNPDVLYLQSTPMTEPLLFGLVLLSICLVYDWVEVQDRAEALCHRDPGIVAQASSSPVAQGAGSSVAQGAGSSVAQGSGSSVAQGSGSSVAQGFSPVSADRARATAGLPAVAHEAEKARATAGLPTVARVAQRARATAGLPAVARVAQRARAKAGWCLVLACLTRYEAWLVTAAVLVLGAIALWRRGLAPAAAVRATADLATYPVLAIVGFFFHSWFTTGAWFVTGGFFIPDNVATGNVWKAFMAVVYGMRRLIGTPFTLLALAGVLALFARGISRAERSASIVVLALVALMVLPAYAFYSGHPFRMRYMVAPSIGAAVLAGIAVGLLHGRWRVAAAAATAVWLVATLRPIDPQAPMVQEAQWDVPFSLGRRNVTECLAREYHGERILASMGSLAHYMQELSHIGINIRDFVHEGTLPYWQEAIEAPEGRVGWILIEERAEGGDMLAKRMRESSAFTLGFTRICADGGVALYRSRY